MWTKNYYTGKKKYKLQFHVRYYKAEIIFKPAFGTSEIVWNDSPMLHLQQPGIPHMQLFVRNATLSLLCLPCSAGLSSQVAPCCRWLSENKIYCLTLDATQSEKLATTMDIRCLNSSFYKLSLPPRQTWLSAEFTNNKGCWDSSSKSNNKKRNKYILVLIFLPQNRSISQKKKKKVFIRKQKFLTSFNNDLLHSSCAKDHAEVKHCLYSRSIVLEKIGN